MKLKSLKRRVSIILALCFLISCTSPMGTVVDLKANVTVDQFYDFRNGSIVPTDTDGKSDITAANGQKITVVECDGTYKALNAGSANVTARS